MAFRTWVRLLLATLGVGALAGASQLGVAYGLGIVRLTRVLDLTTRDQWTAQLAWVAWFAMTAAVAGALVGAGLLARWRPQSRAGSAVPPPGPPGSPVGPSSGSSATPSPASPVAASTSPFASSPASATGSSPAVPSSSTSPFASSSASPHAGSASSFDAGPLSGSASAGRVFGAGAGAGASTSARLAGAAPPGIGTVFALALAAGIGAAVVVPLTMQPARTAQIAGVHPVFVIGICTGLGALVGVFAAIAALMQPVARWSLATVSIAIWVVAVASVAPSLAPDDPLPAVRLGVFDAGYLSPAVTQRTALFTMPALALVAGALVGWAARRRGRSTLTIALAGLPGPVLLTLAYLIAGPGSGTDRYQVVPYWAAMTATGAGVLGSVLAAVLRRGGDTDEDGPTADRPTLAGRSDQPDSATTKAGASPDGTPGPGGAGLGLGAGAASGSASASTSTSGSTASGSTSGSASRSGKPAGTSVFDAIKRTGKGSSTAGRRGIPRQGGAPDSADVRRPTDSSATSGSPSSGATSAPWGPPSGGPAPFGLSPGDTTLGGVSRSTLPESFGAAAGAASAGGGYGGPASPGPDSGSGSGSGSGSTSGSGSGRGGGGDSAPAGQPPSGSPARGFMPSRWRRSGRKSSAVDAFTTRSGEWPLHPDARGGGRADPSATDVLGHRPDAFSAGRADPPATGDLLGHGPEPYSAGRADPPATGDLRGHLPDPLSGGLPERQGGNRSEPIGGASPSGGPAAADRRPDALGGRPAGPQDSFADADGRPADGGWLDSRSGGAAAAPQSHAGGIALGEYAVHEPAPFDGFARGAATSGAATSGAATSSAGTPSDRHALHAAAEPGPYVPAPAALPLPPEALQTPEMGATRDAGGLLGRTLRPFGRGRTTGQERASGGRTAGQELASGGRTGGHDVLSSGDSASRDGGAPLRHESDRPGRHDRDRNTGGETTKPKGRRWGRKGRHADADADADAVLGSLPVGSVREDPDVAPQADRPKTTPPAHAAPTPLSGPGPVWDDRTPARGPFAPEPQSISPPLPNPEPITPPIAAPQPVQPRAGEKRRGAKQSRTDEDYVDWVSGLGGE